MEPLCKLAQITSWSDHQDLSHVLNIWSGYLHCENLTCGVLTSCRCYQNKKSTWSDRPVRIMRWLGIGGDKLDCSSSSILNPLTRFFPSKTFAKSENMTSWCVKVITLQKVWVLRLVWSIPTNLRTILQYAAGPGVSLSKKVESLIQVHSIELCISYNQRKAGRFFIFKSWREYICPNEKIAKLSSFAKSKHFC